MNSELLKLLSSGYCTELGIFVSEGGIVHKSALLGPFLFYFNLSFSLLFNVSVTLWGCGKGCVHLSVPFPNSCALPP